MIRHWLYHHAQPWQFWYPQSGFIGSAILGLLLAICITATSMHFRNKHERSIASLDAIEQIRQCPMKDVIFNDGTLTQIKCSRFQNVTPIDQIVEVSK